MDNKDARHNKILSDMRNQLLRRNIELTSDGEDDIEIQREIDRKHADEVESVLNEIGVGGINSGKSIRNQESGSRTTEYADDDYEDYGYDEADYDRERYEDNDYDYDDYDDAAADDYLEEGGILDMFFSKKNKKSKNTKNVKNSGSVRKTKEPIYNSSDNITVASDESLDSYYGAEDNDMMNQEELEELESDIDSGRYDDIPDDDPNSGIYEELGGLSAEDDYDPDKDIEPEQGLSDSERMFREKILDEKMPEPAKISANVKWLIAFVILLISFIVVTTLYLTNLAKSKYSEIDVTYIHNDELVVNKGVADKVKGYTTIVLYGVDSRDSNLEQGTNSDSIIIASINDSTKEIKLVSVYRDTLLDIQDDAFDTHKINYAYQIGGPITSMNSLNANLDLYITDYITVDFGAFAEIIDAIGGVEIEIQEKEINNLNKNLAEQIRLSGVFSEGIYEPGLQKLNGQQAVAYSRIRSTDKGDITRTLRQRNVLLKVFEKVTSADGALTSSLIDVSFGCISTSITKDKAIEFITNAKDYKLTTSIGFPFAYKGVSLGDKGSVLVSADLDANVVALHKYLYDDTAYETTDTVKKISSKLSAETGVSSAEVTISEDGNNEGASDDGSPDTITEPPEGMIVDE